MVSTRREADLALCPGEPVWEIYGDRTLRRETVRCIKWGSDSIPIQCAQAWIRDGTDGW